MYNAEISAEEFKVFLQETEEQIELLDNNIVLLEKGNQDILQDVFRAAHTIKGSSAMVGLKPMSELTHAMENLLDNLRGGQISVSPALINALLGGLDTLKLIKDEVKAGIEISRDIGPAIAKLETITNKPSTDAASINKPHLTLSPEIINRAKSAAISGKGVFSITLTIIPESEWAAARALQAFNILSPLGETLFSLPSRGEIEADACGHEIMFLFATASDRDTMYGELASIAEVMSVKIEPFVDHDSGACQEQAKVAVNEARKADGAEKNDSQSFQSVRIDVQVLDNLMNIVEELVIDRSRIGRVGKLLAARYTGDDLVHDLSQTSDHIIKVINELQDNIMKVRMIPIGTILSRFPRLVRDLAQLQQKEVDFVIAGGETELDRSIIEQIRDPLIHLLRNAIDHGVETPDERLKAGKPRMASVKLSASQEQEHIVITLEDDGKGIDGNKVKNSALKKGTITAEAAQTMSEAEAINLIFMAGVSTAEKVSEVSGRGVGMDIARTNIENLGGTIKLETTVNKGTTFTIHLPLTVAIIQGLMVTSGGIMCALPLSSILETIKVRSSEIKTVANREVMRLRDSLFPLLRLGSLFGSVNSHDSNPDRPMLITVVRAGKFKVGLVVDEVLEPQEIVVKPLGNYLGDVEGIAGATICGNGQVALILDVNSLIQRLYRLPMATAAA
jgi:two-component system chemotaxis sensor kinase CheA